MANKGVHDDNNNDNDDYSYDYYMSNWPLWECIRRKVTIWTAFRDYLEINFNSYSNYKTIVLKSIYGSSKFESPVATSPKLMEWWKWIYKATRPLRDMQVPTADILILFVIEIRVNWLNAKAFVSYGYMGLMISRLNMTSLVSEKFSKVRIWSRYCQCYYGIWQQLRSYIGYRQNSA